jgi:hypothetical protein
LRSPDDNGFWSGGRAAWWRGLREEIARRRREREEAVTDERRAECEARLEELKEERQEAQKHSHRWLL